MPDSAVRESGDRVRSAVKNLGYKWPDRHITVNLAPADIRKSGPVYDLPLLLAVLASSGQMEEPPADAAFLGASDPAELATHCMEDIDKEFIKKVQKGDIIVAEKNFGCGSSREHAPIAIKAAGVSCVIAETFARIFYRNAINIGLPILECPAASAAIQAGDKVKVDFDTGIITDETTGETFKAQPFPPFIQNIIKAGGLMKSIEK